MPQEPNRHDEVFQCIVESYIETATPVGSRAISKKYAANLSPATIRNVMADLEEAGFIRQPHTSAGRIPTDKGYRYYVDTLLDLDESEEADYLPEARAALGHATDVEDAAERMLHLLADVTKNAGILFFKNLKRVSYLGDFKPRFEEIAVGTDVRANDRLYVDGTSNIFEQPEFQNAGMIRQLLRAFESKGSLTAFLEKDLEDRAVHIHIGDEVHCDGLSGVSVVVKEYSVGGLPIGCLGVIGPTRMKYDRVIGVVGRMADAMTGFLSELL